MGQRVAVKGEHSRCFEHPQRCRRTGDDHRQPGCKRDQQCRRKRDGQAHADRKQPVRRSQQKPGKCCQAERCGRRAAVSPEGGQSLQQAVHVRREPSGQTAAGEMRFGRSALVPSDPDEEGDKQRDADHGYGFGGAGEDLSPCERAYRQEEQEQHRRVNDAFADDRACDAAGRHTTRPANADESRRLTGPSGKEVVEQVPDQRGQRHAPNRRPPRREEQPPPQSA